MTDTTPGLGALELRAVTEDEFIEYDRVEHVAFGSFPTDEARRVDRSVTELDRTIGAFVDGQLVGTTGAYSFSLTVPGGGTVDAAGVTGVGVLPTHRRRGVLRAMITHQLDDVARRGEPVAILNASESAIYGRFGYGMASEHQTVEIDRGHAAFRQPLAPRRLRLLTRAEGRHTVPPIYEAYRRTRPGAVSRSDAWWDVVFGDHRGWKGGGVFFVVVAEPQGDDPGGYALYDIEHTGPGVAKHLSIRELLAVDDEVEAALFAYCTEVDLVTTVSAVARPLDDPLRWRLADPRRLRVVRQHDYLWVRLVDVCAALEARRYLHDGEAVVEVEDPLRAEVGGRYRLSVRDGVGQCARVDDPPTMRMGVDDLGALWLGGVSARTLARAGRIEAGEPGAVDRVDALFRWGRDPYCTTTF